MTEQRVTGEQLTELADQRRCDGMVLLLITDLRASRAREAELAQRIATVLAMCAAADTDETPRIMFVELLDPRTVQAVLE